MKNKILVMFLIVFSSIVIMNSSAYAKGRHYAHKTQYAYATVLSAEPIIKVFRVSEPERQCFKKRITVVEPVRANRTNRLLGAFLGAAIGNSLGHNKTNKRIGTVAGAMLGSAIVDDASGNTGYTRQQWINQCERVSVSRQQERVIGYRVTYLFQGETYTTRLKRNPGNSLRVRLSVAPRSWGETDD